VSATGDLARMPIDEALGGAPRSLRSRPGTYLLGPTGARLWADYLTDSPGFAGAIDYIHKLNIPLLFTVDPFVPDPGSGKDDLPRARSDEPADTAWFPSHLQMSRSYGALRLHERKTITWDDRAVSEQQWTNNGATAVVLRLCWDPGWCRRESQVVRGRRTIERHGFTVCLAITCDIDSLLDGVVVEPGQSIQATVQATLTLEDEQQSGLPLVAPGVTEPPRSIDDAIEHYQSWFDQTPRFRSSSAMLDRAWHYRWFLLRHNLARPARGALDGWVMYEGRSHKMTKNPWEPAGWEFSKHIPLSTPLHLLEMRWHHDPRFAKGILASLVGRQRPDGQFAAATVTEVMNPYANFSGWAAWKLAEVTSQMPSPVVLEALKRQVRGERDILADRSDGLPVQEKHSLTGKEYQPSYWYFNRGEYPDRPSISAPYTPLKRVDRAVYQYLNAQGVRSLCDRRGDSDAEEFQRIADRVRTSIETLCWDDERRFYFDLHHRTNERALVRNVVGFYPWWAGLGGDHAEAVARALNDPDGFRARTPVPSVETSCPVYSPGGGWNGLYFKGPRGCVWNGPTWPYTNSIVLDAVGRTSRRVDHGLDPLFARLLRSYLLLHFDNEDGHSPYLVEHYNPETGEPISDEVDYNHSYLIDLIIGYVAGLVIEADGIRIDPLRVGLSWFALDNVHVAGHSVSISYNERHGLAVTVDDCSQTVDPDGKSVTVRWASLR